MSKLTIAGLVSWFIGGLLFGFQAIESLVRTGGDMDWKNMILMDVIGKSHFDLPYNSAGQTLNPWNCKFKVNFTFYFRELGF